MSGNICVIGAGVSGLVCAHMLSKKYDVDIIEANDYAGGMKRRKHEISFPPLFTAILKFIAGLPSVIRNRLLVRSLKSSHEK